MDKKDQIIQSSLVKETFKEAFRTSTPLLTTIEITQSCNFKCTHCYNYDRSSAPPKDLIEDSLKDSEIIQLIKQISDLGGLYLNLSGGEVLTHPSLGRFISYAKELNLLVKIKTNGALLTQKKVQELYDQGLDGLDLSLYGSNEKTYKDFTNSSNFSNVLSSLKSSKEIGLDVHASIILHRNNVNELDEMIKICEDLKIPFQISYEVTKRYDDTENSRDQEITIEQFEALLQGKHSDRFMSYNTDNSFQCSCARSVCGISSSGDVLPCVGAPIKSGNIRNQSLSEIWKNSDELNKIRQIKKDDFKECVICDVKDFCTRSSGSIFINTGNYLGCEEMTYKQASLRKKYYKTSTD
ncbi:radical SAM/SPASM domain-containing protein [Halobacteriovorax sp. HLS]|uniref:radical SAM/SPASM domain-containing protein n=1 Tax=Halobacteriovorax sp. HLS TaxID=2234000 RepID=UPI0013E34521|nr:radical SAM protein [Halobacteriovorax sp. HLS]